LVETLAYGVSTSCLLAIILAFKWRTNLWRTNRTGPALFIPSSEQSCRSLSAVNQYISEAVKAMQQNNKPTRPSNRNLTAQVIGGIKMEVPEENHALIPINEPPDS